MVGMTPHGRQPHQFVAVHPLPPGQAAKSGSDHPHPMPQPGQFPGHVGRGVARPAA